MSVKVKAYLLGTDDSVKEVRKFELDIDTSTNVWKNTTVEKLKATVESLFDVSYFKLYYKDEEGDLVAFSTDDEIKFGVACMKDTIFRLYIRDGPKS